MKIVGYHILNGIIANSDEEINCNPPYLDFLLQPKEDTIRICYHLGYAIANLIKNIKLTKEECIELHEDTSLVIYPYELRYIPNKFFSIRKYGRFAYYCDASQYMEYFDSSSLISNGQIEEQCIKLANKAKEVGEGVFKALEELGLKPDSITSPIRVYEKAVLEKLDLPTCDDVDVIDPSIGEYAYKCCQGGWVEAFKLGHWDVAYDYDVNAAYPYQIMNLMDFRQGNWNYIKGNNQNQHAYYGYYKCKTNVTGNIVPVIHQISSDNDISKNYTVNGKRQNYLTKAKINHLRYWKTGEVDIIDGWEWIPDPGKKQVTPLRQQIQWLYNEKQKTNGNYYKKDNIKRIMAGIFGKMTEWREGEFGRWLNTPWTAEIENNTQIKVADFALQNGIVPIHIAVDGLVSEKQIGVENQDEIGSWRLNSAGSCMCIGSGTVALKNKEKTGDFSLGYDWIVQNIREFPDAKEYSMKKISPVTLDIAVSQNKFEKIGELQEIERTVYVEYEDKRWYRKMPNCGKDLMNNKYESRPLDISMLKMR